MPTKRLNLVDTAWLNVETENAPMQVGGLLVFKMPEDGPQDLPRRLIEHYHRYTRAYSPWNHRLKSGPLRNVAPEWELLDEIDVKYHFRHSALPAPGGERELGELASRLHSHPLDFSRPPWEAYVIEGLAGGRFAIYIKLHHSLIDGIAGMRQLAKALTDDPNDMQRPPWWALEPKKKSRSKDPQQARPGLYRAVAQLVGGAREQVGSLPGFARVVRGMLKSARSDAGAVGLPFSARASILNSRIQAQRRYATQLYSLSEFKDLAHAAEVTINDIVLTICGGAIRRYLRELGELPTKPLTAGIPVSVRPADDDDAGNALTFIVASLGTDEADIETRLRAVARSTQRAKDDLSALSAAAITQYTVALMAPYVLSLVTGMGGRTRPVFNVTVSNVPGPKGPLYAMGAEMEAFYPTSLVTHGQALNITVHGYGDTLGFGFIGCRETLPSLQKIAVYAGEELDKIRGLYGRREAASEQPEAPAQSPAQPAKAKTRAKKRGGPGDAPTNGSGKPSPAAGESSGGGHSRASR